MSSLMVHAGGELCTVDDLKLISTPPDTDSYSPVPHSKIVEMIHETAYNNNLEVIKTEVATKDRKRGTEIQHGAKLFGVVTLGTNGNNTAAGDELSATLGFRSSLDKSIAPGFVGGSGVFVCDNMVLSGELIQVRKQTKNVVFDVYQILFNMVERVKERFLVDQELRHMLKDISLEQRQGMDILGSFAAHGHLGYAGGSSSPFALAIREWESPTFEEFHARNMWSLFNAGTFGLKRTNLNNSFESNIRLTKRVVEDYAPSLLNEYASMAL